MKSHSRRAALRGQARLAQSCGCQDPRPETERPAGYARSSGEARVAPCPWHPSGTCGPPLGRRPHPWGSPLLLLPGTWPGPGGPLLPRSTPLLLAGGSHTHPRSGVCTEAPYAAATSLCLHWLRYSPLLLKVLPDFSELAAPMFLASVVAPFSPGPTRPRIHAVSALCPDGAPTQASPVPSTGPHPRGLHASPSPGKPPGDSAPRHALSAPFKAHLVQVNTEWCVSLRCPLLFTAFWSCLSDQTVSSLRIRKHTLCFCSLSKGAWRSPRPEADMQSSSRGATE